MQDAPFQVLLAKRNVAISDTLGGVSGRPARSANEKGAVRVSERPKSREETPKEGCGNEPRSSAAPKYISDAVHKRQLHFLQSSKDVQVDLVLPAEEVKV